MNEKRNELLLKLKECEAKMNELAWGIQSHEDFLEFSKYAEQATAYRKSIKAMDKGGRNGRP